MPKFQLLGCKINVGGDRNTTVVRDRFDPITYPEYLVLRALHGGEEHVYDAVDVGEREYAGDERERLSQLYGRELVLSVFPGAMLVLPRGDDTIPTEAELTAAHAAAREARERVRAKAAAPKKTEPFGGKGDHDGDGKPGGTKVRKSGPPRAPEPPESAGEPGVVGDDHDDDDEIPDLTTD